MDKLIFPCGCPFEETLPGCPIMEPHATIADFGLAGPAGESGEPGEIERERRYRPGPAKEVIWENSRGETFHIRYREPRFDFHVSHARGQRRRLVWRLEGRLLYRDWWEYSLYTRNPFSTRIKTMLDWLEGRTLGGGYAK